MSSKIPCQAPLDPAMCIPKTQIKTADHAFSMVGRWPHKFVFNSFDMTFASPQDIATSPELLDHSRGLEPLQRGQRAQRRLFLTRPVNPPMMDTFQRVGAVRPVREEAAYRQFCEVYCFVVSHENICLGRSGMCNDRA
ncbi:MAG: hypothetical protein JWM03_1469 [Rhodocyclales bacterium]|nr:hypothetical protein [Rhodocyclales bacterium]MDB5888597.1 hypothetical protein [Rhodocyclales bacterium]